MTQTLLALSASVSRLVTSSARLLSAIRLGPARHITGLVCGGDTIVTVEQALPPQDRYMVALPNRLPVPARPGPRDPALNLTILRLDSAWPAADPEIATAAVGNLVILLGADEDASPTIRLTVIHRFSRTPEGPAPVLDLPGDRLDQGSLVLDLEGRLIGLAARDPNGEAMAIPGTLIGRMLTPNAAIPPPLPHPARRGWLGVALQPITVPDQLVAKAGQGSGRMVVSITKGGPAELAGMRIGDVLLALDGTSTSGPQALRAFLGGDRIGTTVEVKLLRDGNLVATHLTIAIQPS